MKYKQQFVVSMMIAMKFTVSQLVISAIFVCSLYANDARSQADLSKTFSVNVTNTEIADLLRTVSKQTEIKFSYSFNAIEAKRIVTYSAKEKKLKDFLDEFLNKLGVGYKIVDDQVILFPLKEATSNTVITNDNRLNASVYENLNRDVSGKVVNENGEPVAGATVTQKGTTNSVMTGNDGSFTINIKSDVATLVISNVGFKTYEIAVGQNILTVSIVLKSEIKALNDVIVVGYGTQRKSDVTGAISSVKSDQIRQVPVMSAEQALQGRAAGVQVIQTNGAPGGAPQVQIRGVNSTSATGNEPLYVVDGVPLFDPGGEQVPNGGGASRPERNVGSPLATINPNDIERMDILKDASATAIYGARAANGVVVITTKSGKAGKTVFSLDYYRGIQQIQKKWDLLNAIEGMAFRKEALLNVVSDFNRNTPSEYFNPYSFATSPTYKNTEWQDVLFRNAPMQDVNLTVSGGTEKVRFLVSGNAFNQDGIFLNTYMKRYSNRVNLDIKANNRLNFGIRTGVSFQEGNNVTDGNPFQGTVIGAFYQQVDQAYYPDGSYWQRPNLQSSLGNRNPAFEAMEFTRKINRFRFNANVFGEFEITKGLKFKSTFGLDYTTLGQKLLNPAIPRGPSFEIAGPDLGPGGTTKAYSNNGNTYNWITEHTLNYNKILGKHNFESLLGFSAQQFTNTGLFNSGTGSLTYGLNLIGVNNGQNLAISESFSQSGLVSQFARVNYNYGGRYFVTGTVRRDGSSNFGEDNRYGTFPSASIGWRISQEGFFQNIKAISDLKIRASYGLTGNQNIGTFRFLSRMTSTPAAFGGSVVNGFSPNGLSNQSLKWEANKQTDIGIDIGFFNGRLNITADYYVKNSKDLLVGIPIPTFSGFNSLTVNLGTIQNKGYEFAANTRILNGGFKWDLNFNIATLENKVINLGTNAAGGVNEFYGYTPFTTNGPVNRTTIGEPIGSFYGLITNGIFQSSQETVGYPVTAGMFASAGDMKYVDQNKDGIISDLDRVYLGSPFPKYYGGITNDFSYNNITLSVFGNFVSGNKIFNHQRLMLEDMGDASGSANQLNRWTTTNPGNEYPRATLGGASAYNRLNSNRWIDDGSYFRVRNITLSYNLPTALLSHIKMQSVRIYGSVNNAFTLTKYKGWDPEVNSSGSDVLSSGIDQGGYPVARSFILGVNLKF